MHVRILNYIIKIPVQIKTRSNENKSYMRVDES